MLTCLHVIEYRQRQATPQLSPFLCIQYTVTINNHITKERNKAMERKWDLYDKLLECIGGEELSLSLCKALSSDDMNETLEYIARCFDIEEGGEDD